MGMISNMSLWSMCWSTSRGWRG
ncbi:hypothetical protein LINPERPRIM_LOCUS5974 [Linum perenne]